MKEKKKSHAYVCLTVVKHDNGAESHLLCLCGKHHGTNMAPVGETGSSSKTRVHHREIIDVTESSHCFLSVAVLIYSSSQLTGYGALLFQPWHYTSFHKHRWCISECTACSWGSQTDVCTDEAERDRETEKARENDFLSDIQLRKPTLHSKKNVSFWNITEYE